MKFEVVEESQKTLKSWQGQFWNFQTLKLKLQFPVLQLKEEDIKQHNQWHRKSVPDSPIIISVVAPRSCIRDTEYCCLKKEIQSTRNHNKF